MRVLYRVGALVCVAAVTEVGHAQEAVSEIAVCQEGLELLRAGDIDDWRVRARAQDLIVPGADRNPNDAGCLLALGELRFAQGAITDAHRMLRRAEGLLRPATDSGSRARLADLMYLRALWMDDWIRNFDYLINLGFNTLAVTTPECLGSGAFCLNFLRPREFNAGLDAAPSLAGVIQGRRYELRALLDSLLLIAPAHERAVRLRLRRALVDENWADLGTVAERARQAGLASPVEAFAQLLASARGHGLALSDAFAHYISRVPPESLAVYEEDVTGAVAVERVEALWALSDPLLLTDVNERRVQWHVRLAMAEIGYSDPERRLPGRLSQPGRLILRYGWPRRIWELPRSAGSELDENQMRAVARYMECAGAGGCPAAELNLPRSGGTQAGRWTFFNYDLGLPSFIFERNLSVRTYEYKRMTMTEAMDSALARNVPSTFESPYGSIAAAVLVTRFPRPNQPAIEVHGRFQWQEHPEGIDSVQLGAFVHERIAGQLVNQGTARRAGWGRTALSVSLNVVFGPLQVSVEAMVPEHNLAVQRRTELRLEAPSGLGLSDLLLGTDVTSDGVPSTRAEVGFVARADSLPRPGEPLALYWETYGLATDGEGVHRYRVTLTVRESGGGRSMGAEFLRGVGNLLNLRADGRNELTWERVRSALPGYAPEALVVRLPDRTGNLTVVVQIDDLVAGTRATIERLVAVRAP